MTREHTAPQPAAPSTQSATAQTQATPGRSSLTEGHGDDAGGAQPGQYATTFRMGAAPIDTRTQAGREDAMMQIVRIRRLYAPQINAAAAASGARENSRRENVMSQLETIEYRMDMECAPYIEALMRGDSAHRYEHADHGVTEEVAAAVRLHTAQRGVWNTNRDEDAHAEALRVTNIHNPKTEWCGAFAFAQARQAGGMDQVWHDEMEGTTAMTTALQYLGRMANTWIWANGTWHPLREYHESRGSSREYALIDRSAPSMGIHPGDIILIDNVGDGGPHHITTAISFDGRHLTTVGGNQGQNDDAVSRTRGSIDLTQNHTAEWVRVHPRARSRVHSVGRWSLVDFEHHTYTRSTDRPTAPPSTSAHGRR